MRKRLLNALGVLALLCFIAAIGDSLAHHHERCWVCGGRLRFQCNVQLDRGNAETDVRKLVCTGCGNVEFHGLRITRTASGELNPDGPSEQQLRGTSAD